MAKRSSARIDHQELISEKSEVRCMWAGLFSILNSCQGYASPFKFISSRRPVKTNVTDNPRTKLDDQIASFDEECRKTQNEEANLARIRVNASEKSVRNLILDDMHIDRHKNKQIIVKGQQLTKTDSELVVDPPVKTHKAARKKSRSTAYQSSSNAKAVEKNVQQARMSVKAFIDQMFVDGKFVHKEWTSNEPMPFSDALGVLSTNNKDLFMELLQEPNSHEKSSSRASNGKQTTFSVREIKQKLKHPFGDFRKEPNRFSKAGDDCRFRVVDTRDCSNSSNNAKTKEKLGKKLELKPDNEPDIAFLTETARKKIDFSSSRFSRKQDFDVALETKRRHIFARLKSLNAIGEPQIVETKNIFDSEVPSERNRADTILLNDEDGTVIHSTLDSVSENETFTSTVDDVPSTPTSVHDFLNMSESIKYQEEHRSPVSVLERFFAEDASNPSNIMPRRIYFEECSIESSTQDQPIGENACNDEQDYISQYVHLVLQASCLNWDRLSKISPRSEELLQASLFDEVEFWPSDYHFDPKILFDHINEVLLQIHRSHFSFLPRPAFVKPKNSSVPLEELVLDEITREAAEFYLHPRTEERTTVDQLVVNDVSDSRSWIDVRPEAERIMIHISEHILEESVSDIIRGFRS